MQQDGETTLFGLAPEGAPPTVPCGLGLIGRGQEVRGSSIFGRNQMSRPASGRKAQMR